MKLSLPPAMNVNFNVSVVVKAATTNAHVSSWTVTGFWNSTEGYLRNDMQLDITRSTAEDEDFKVYSTIVLKYWNSQTTENRILSFESSEFTGMHRCS